MLPRTPFRLLLVFGFTVFGMIFSANNAYSDNWEINDFERKIKLKILPEYCAYMQGGSRAGSSNAPRYKEYLGEGWRHTHHYCWGLDKMLLATLNIADDHQYKYYLGSALTEFDYVLKRVSDSFILKPEVLSRRGMALSSLERDAEATHSFLSAIQLKPDYVFSYIELSKLYSKKGKMKQAREVLNRALKHSPNSPRLKEALAKLE